MASGAERWALVLVAVAACTTPPPKGAHEVKLGCPAGPVSAEIARVMPPMGVKGPVTLVPPEHLKKAIEPGCLVPFRDETADEKQRGVGKVLVSTIARGAAPVPLGRGRLFIGRGAMTLVVNDDSGDEALGLSIEDRRVVVRRKGHKLYRGSVALGPGKPLPLPVDALLAAIEGCATDTRLGTNEDVSIVEARRGGFPLLRTRWLDAENPAAVDTGLLCGDQDAWIGYRSTAGSIGWSLTVVSARSELGLKIEQVVRKETDAKDDEEKPDFELKGADSE